MATWREEFTRRSDKVREELEKWKADERNSNILINAMDRTKDLLITYTGQGEPARDQEMPF